MSDILILVVCDCIQCVAANNTTPMSPALRALHRERMIPTPVEDTGNDVFKEYGEKPTFLTGDTQEEHGPVGKITLALYQDIVSILHHI